MENMNNKVAAYIDRSMWLYTSLFVHPKLLVSSSVDTACMFNSNSLTNSRCSCTGITLTYKNFFRQ